MSNNKHEQNEKEGLKCEYAECDHILLPRYFTLVSNFEKYFEK